MPGTPKVFIYNGPGAADESVDDLKELFSSTAIFGERPDISISPFSFNPAGLNFPALVIPGGMAIKMTNPVKTQISRCRFDLNERFHYVGICAGGFLGSSQTNYFVTTNMLHANGDFETPYYWQITENSEILTDYNAIGSFYPARSHHLRKDHHYVPYRVSLKLADGQCIPQMYLAGPGFYANQPTASTEVVATYANSSSYQFTFFEDRQPENKTFTNLGAIIKSTPTETRGGRLLAGTHLEACVPNSRFLGFFRSDHAEQNCTALPGDDLAALDEAQESNLQFVHALLRSTLN